MATSESLGLFVFWVGWFFGIMFLAALTLMSPSSSRRDPDSSRRDQASSAGILTFSMAGVGMMLMALARVGCGYTPDGASLSFSGYSLPLGGAEMVYIIATVALTIITMMAAWLGYEDA